MKKLIIAAFAVAFAAVAQAAQVKWQTGDAVYAMGETVASNYLICFMNSAEFSYADATAKVALGDATFATTIYAKATGSTGKASVTWKTDAGNAETYTGYLVIFNAATIADATHMYLTNEQSGTTGATGQAATLSWKDQLGGTKTAGNWAEIAPEPTSGLMMLLGMGVLALRRRRA